MCGSTEKKRTGGQEREEYNNRLLAEVKTITENDVKKMHFIQ